MKTDRPSKLAVVQSAAKPKEKAGARYIVSADRTVEQTSATGPSNKDEYTYKTKGLSLPLLRGNNKVLYLPLFLPIFSFYIITGLFISYFLKFVEGGAEFLRPLYKILSFPSYQIIFGSETLDQTLMFYKLFITRILCANVK